MTGGDRVAATLLRTLDFAARRHRDQRRKGTEGAPYVNHLIEVAHLLAEAGVTDLVTLQAALLHDTLEDTGTTADELRERFGEEVARVVQEVSDDKRLPWEERKRLQVEHASGLSARAKLVKVADKISNIWGVVRTPPASWSMDRRRQYLEWTEAVVRGCRGCSAELETLYDQALAEGWRALGEEEVR